MKKLTAFLCALFLLGNGMTPTLSAFAETIPDDSATEITQEITVDDLTFTIYSYSGSVVLTGCTSTASEIVIPSEVEGRPVTEIGDNAFAGLTTLTSVLIPESVTAISETAFEGTSLQKVFLEGYLSSDCNVFDYHVDVYEYYHIPYDTDEYTMEFKNSISYRKYSDHIEIMEMDYMLSELVVPAEIDGLPVTAVYAPIRNDLIGGITTNDYLQSITIPETVTALSLAYCTALEEIILEGDNPAYTVSDGVLFSKDMTVLEQYPLGLTASSYTIPDSVKTISSAAFSKSTLQSVTIPEGVTSIGYSAFSECEQLRSVTLPDTVTSIGSNAFNKCSALTSINIPEGVTAIEAGTFMFCGNLESVTLPDSLLYIDEVAFYGTGLTELVLPEQLTTIGVNAFNYCANLTTVSIPASVTVMEDQPFFACTALTSFNVDAENPSFCDVDGVLMTKDQSTLLCYPNARQAKSYTIPASVSVINKFAFAECGILESLVIPETVTELGDYTFEKCPNLRSVVILADTNDIGQYAFYSCPNLSEIVMTNTITSVGFRAFSEIADNPEVYYLGSEQEWNSMDFESGNDKLTGGNLHFNYVHMPLSTGNLNGDERIDSSDAALLLMDAANEGATGVSSLTDAQKIAADVNMDGARNAADAALILQYAAYIGTGGTDSIADWLNETV